MHPAPRALEEPYRSRALPPGSARHLSWLFAAPPMRAPLLGLYALTAELHALTDPGTEVAAAELKLAWWREEIERLARGAPVHPIGLHLASLPRAAEVEFRPLIPMVEAALRQVAGAPLERAADLEALAAPWGAPLRLASELAHASSADESEAVHRSASALACAQYLAAALDGYARAARAGRVILPVDELLAAGIEDRDLAAAEPPVHLQSYLERLRGRAREHYAAAEALPRAVRASQRHVAVLAAVGAAQLRERGPQRWRDLFLAWSTARRAVRGSARGPGAS
jgi:phytoene/squalene synthetase